MRGDDGGKPLGKVAAMQIAKVAGEGSISAWIRLARSVTVNQLKKEVSAARRRDSVVPLEGVAAGTNEGRIRAGPAGPAERPYRSG